MPRLGSLAGPRGRHSPRRLWAGVLGQLAVPSDRRQNQLDTRLRRSDGEAGEDPKVAALRAERSLNPRPEAVSDERFSASEFLDARDLVQVKYEMVRRARVDGEPVGRAAAAFGFSRPSFYAAERALDEGGLAALVPARPGPRGAHKLTRRGRGVRARASGGRPGAVVGGDLVELIAERFGVRVHRRSVERALARARARGKRGGPMSRAAGARDVERYEQLRAQALEGDPSGVAARARVARAPRGCRVDARLADRQAHASTGPVGGRRAAPRSNEQTRRRAWRAWRWRASRGR